MRSIFVTLVLAAMAVAAPAQAPAADPEILKTVERFFDAMRARDTVTLKALVDSSARLVTAFTRDGKPAMRSAGIQRFIQNVGGAQQLLDERIFEPEARQDGNLATVWTRYVFYLGGTLSHCGYDAFQLARTEGGWKVVAIADTQRREGCGP
ncbi:MAG: nuclear transport factor 2 family protein [Gemmatimonadales bacterium]